MASPVAKEHDGISDGVLRLMRQHPMPQPTVYLLPLIFRGHAETLVSFLPAEITSCEFAQRQTPLMILVCPAVVVWTVRLKILVELHATEYEAERPTFIPKKFPQYGTLLSIVLRQTSGHDLVIVAFLVEAIGAWGTACDAQCNAS